MAIDYGRRRSGIAVTDPLKIVANGLTTVATADVPAFVSDYIKHEDVEAVVVGMPRDMHGNESESMRYIRPAVTRLLKTLPDMKVIFFDERFTSVLAHKAMIDGGMRKSRRRDKATVDTMAAAIILNDYLQSKSFNQSI